jgi:23S rRNA (cytosine1962-C5)-methyltransferase
MGIAPPGRGYDGSSPTGFEHDGPVDDYELIDAGGGARLERFGEHIVDRPHGAAVEERRSPGRWTEADLRFDRDGGWTGSGTDAARAGWTVTYHGLSLELRPTEAGQVGLFPEHGVQLPGLRDQVVERGMDGPVTVLNLFAYTGLTSLALAREGASVTHVDASRPAVAWARRNAAHNGLEDRPIRWIVDDARSYADREVRRGRRYDGIILDPPTYGHGTAKTAWRLEDDLAGLLASCERLLATDGFLLLTAHTEGYGPDRLYELLADAVGGERRLTNVAWGDLEIPTVAGGRLTLGAYTGFDRRA